MLSQGGPRHPLPRQDPRQPCHQHLRDVNTALGGQGQALRQCWHTWQQRGRKGRIPGSRDTGKRLEGELTLPCPVGRRRRGVPTCIHTVTTLWAGDTHVTSGCTSVHVQGKERKHLPWKGSELYQGSSTSDREQETGRKGKGKESSGWFVIAAKQKGLVRPGQVKSINEQGARQGHFDHRVFFFHSERQKETSTELMTPSRPQFTSVSLESYTERKGYVQELSTLWGGSKCSHLCYRETSTGRALCTQLSCQQHQEPSDGFAAPFNKL